MPVVRACQKISSEVEANPDRFMHYTYRPLLVTARERIAQLIGAETDECVIVPNATHGINTVLRNLEWSHNDIIVGSEFYFCEE